MELRWKVLLYQILWCIIEVIIITFVMGGLTYAYISSLSSSSDEAYVPALQNSTFLGVQNVSTSENDFFFTLGVLYILLFFIIIGMRIYLTYRLKNELKNYYNKGAILFTLSMIPFILWEFFVIGIGLLVIFIEYLWFGPLSLFSPSYLGLPIGFMLIILLPQWVFNHLNKTHQKKQIIKQPKEIIVCQNCGKKYFSYRVVCPYCSQKVN